jgi:undecaprenyl-diphosphatase
MEELNQSLFLLLNANTPSTAMITLATFLAEWLIYAVPLLLAGLWLWGRREQRTAALTGVLSVALALVCSQLISTLWSHPRPFMLGLGQTFLAHAPEASFPSDHATVLFSLGFALLISALRKTAAALLLSGIVVGWARVYLGVHFPFDILGALLVAYAACRVAVPLQNNSVLGSRLLTALESLYRLLFALPIAKGWVRE